jgi:hypothetical protein
MQKREGLEKFGVRTIADAVDRFGVGAARERFAGMIGAVALDVSGVVAKVVKREGEEKLVIEPGDVPGFVVFAVFPGGLENLTKPYFLKAEKLKKLKNKSVFGVKIRKGSTVTISGKLASFGASAVCLNDCRFAEVRAKKERELQ